MATGYKFADRCYSSIVDATSAKWSAAKQTDATPGTTSYLTNIEWSGTAWVLNRYTLSSTGTLTLNTTTALPAQSFETCDTSAQFLDGLTVGWGVAAAMIVAAVIMAARRGMP